MSKYWLKIDEAVEGPYEGYLLKFVEGFSADALVSSVDAADQESWVKANEVAELHSILGAVRSSASVTIERKVEPSSPKEPPVSDKAELEVDAFIESLMSNFPKEGSTLESKPEGSFTQSILESLDKFAPLEKKETPKAEEKTVPPVEEKSADATQELKRPDVPVSEKSESKVSDKTEPEIKKEIEPEKEKLIETVKEIAQGVTVAESKESLDEDILDLMEKFSLGKKEEEKAAAPAPAQTVPAENPFDKTPALVADSMGSVAPVQKASSSKRVLTEIHLGDVIQSIRLPHVLAAILLIIGISGAVYRNALMHYLKSLRGKKAVATTKVMPAEQKVKSSPIQTPPVVKEIKQEPVQVAKVPVRAKPKRVVAKKVVPSEPAKSPEPVKQKPQVVKQAVTPAEKEAKLKYQKFVLPGVPAPNVGAKPSEKKKTVASKPSETKNQDWEMTPAPTEEKQDASPSQNQANLPGFSTGKKPASSSIQTAPAAAAAKPAEPQAKSVTASSPAVDASPPPAPKEIAPVKNKDEKLQDDFFSQPWGEKDTKDDSAK